MPQGEPTSGPNDQPVGYIPPMPTGGGGGENYMPTEGEYATGGSFVVPPGYPNDTYRIGLTSGEQVDIIPAGQSPDTVQVPRFSDYAPPTSSPYGGQAAEVGGDTTIIFNDQTEATHALSLAWVETQKISRLRASIGL